MRNHTSFGNSTPSIIQHHEPVEPGRKIHTFPGHAFLGDNYEGWATKPKAYIRARKIHRDCLHSDRSDGGFSPRLLHMYQHFGKPQQRGYVSLGQPLNTRHEHHRHCAPPSPPDGRPHLWAGRFLPKLITLWARRPSRCMAAVNTQEVRAAGYVPMHTSKHGVHIQHNAMHHPARVASPSPYVTRLGFGGDW
jgi:hypothetical protein